MSRGMAITGFTDEISPDLIHQIATAARLGLSGIDLRSVGGINILALDDATLDLVRSSCAHAGLVIQSIGSPVNKVFFTPENRISENEKLRKAIKVAQYLEVSRIRIFTPETAIENHLPDADGVLDWMSEQSSMARASGVVLLHENDAKFWGAYPQNAKLLFESLASPHFKAAFDFANTVLLGFSPIKDWLPWIVPYLDTLHIKDALANSNIVVPAGKGDAQIKEFLIAAYQRGWDGPLTLEPHLQTAETFGGYSGEELFEVAANALTELLNQVEESINA